jgi:glucose/arabinose dehydrogenase
MRKLIVLLGMGVAIANANEPVFEPFVNVGSLAIAVRHAGDTSGRVFVATQNGNIRVVNNSGSLVTTPFLTINGSTVCQWAGASATPGFTSGGERGLLGLAFHPQYSVNRRFFINFTDSGGHTNIAELLASSTDPNIAEAGSCKILMRVKQDFSNHNGGNLLFGPDGLLYIGMGDGGSGGDPCNRGQTLNPANLNDTGNCTVGATFNVAALPGNPNSRALLGKMLRIDVNGTTATGHSLCGTPSNLAAGYSIPATNVFANGATKCPEVLYYGLRNPWRWSFDRLTGDLIIGDVGQNAVEEISFVRRAPEFSGGLNFGWNCFEGESSFSATGSCAGANLAATHDPVMPLPQGGSGGSITGGYIYRGPKPALSGLYIAADYIKSEFYLATPSNLTAPGSAQPNWAFRTFTNSSLGFSGVVTSFGEDEAGNVYVATANGAILRVSAWLKDGFE